MKKGLLIVGGLILVAMVLFGQVMGTRNTLVQQREGINGQFAQVDAALQRRADLIPNLVNTVKGFAKQESEVFTNIANARAALLGARSPQEKIEANSRLDGALGRLLVLQENYPQLKSNENFLRLQDELAGTENRLNVERRKYNEFVTRYNTSIDLFPNNIAASLFGFRKDAPYFATDPANRREAPRVQF